MNLEDILTSDNLVPSMDKSEVEAVYKQIEEQYSSDLDSMGDYLRRYESALDLARMDSSKVETRLKNGSKVMMPFIMEAAIDFNARVVMEVLSRDDIVFADVKGPDSDEKEERARRVTEFANYSVDRMRWRRITDKEMMALPIVGTTYKKEWYDPVKGRPCTGMAYADEIVFSQEVECFDDAPQVAHELSFSRNYVESMSRAGLWEIDTSELDESKQDFSFREIQFSYDIDGDGYAEPYIAMVCDDAECVVRIVPNFDPEDIVYGVDGDIIHIEKTRYITQKQLIPDPEGSPMGMGFGILLHDIFHTINTNVRQLTDAGTLQNLSANSGLIAHGVQPRGNQASRAQMGDIEMELGRFKQVQVSGAGSLRDSIVQFPFGGPSPTLFQLLGHMEDAARRMAVAGQQIDANAGEAASLYLARLNQALKAPNAMIWRVCQGFEDEFECLFKLIYKYGDDAKYQAVTDDPQASIRDDFNPDDCDIKPTMTPSQGSDYERMARAEVVLEKAMVAPQIHNVREAFVNYYKAMGVSDIERIAPEPDPNAVDPLQQLQMQYQAMEAEFRNREMSVKEQKLAIEQMKAVADMRAQVEQMRIDADSASADRVKTLTEAMKNLAEIADMEEAKALRTINTLAMGGADGRELSAIQPGRNTYLAQRPGDAGISAMPGMVSGATGGRS